MKTFPSQTLQAALNAASELAELGWRVIPNDRPAAAEIGFLAKKTYNGNLVERRIVWHPFGHLLFPQIQVVGTEDEFLDLFKHHLVHRIFKCDDPEADRLGFVCYCKQKERRSTVFQMPVAVAEHLGSVFLEIREAAEGENLRALLVDA